MQLTAYIKMLLYNYFMFIYYFLMYLKYLYPKFNITLQVHNII